MNLLRSPIAHRSSAFLRLLLAALPILLLAQTADAQIYAVTFKNEKAANKYKKHLIELSGEPTLVGEALSGIRIDEQRGQIFYAGAGKNELVVPDPRDPGSEPYKFDDGERVPASKRHVVAVQGKDIARIRVLMRDETLSGLANEYRLKTAQIDEYEDARDEAERGSAEWLARHARLVAAMERLREWLASTAFPDVAEKLAKDIAREEKSVRESALADRRERALASVERVEPHERLVELAQEISGGKHVFRAMRSQHLRMDYTGEIPDVDVEEALRLGEEVIDGFRTEFVDPYLAEDYLDRVPDGVFQVWLYVPNDDVSYERYTAGFWGVQWTDDREERLAMGGGRTEGSSAVPYRTYRKNRDLDLPAIITHDLGHALAGHHFGNGAGFIRQDWLSEGAAYYLSFEYLGRNGVTCKAFDKEKAGYVRREVKRAQGDKTVGIGRRDIFNEVALFKGRPIDQLALRDLVVMDDADLAKAWSFFDYVARKEGEAGQRWLRAAGAYSSDPNTFIAKWREKAAEVLGVGAAEAFRAVEERWRSWAETGQDTGDRKRR